MALTDPVHGDGVADPRYSLHLLLPLGYFFALSTHGLPHAAVLAQRTLGLALVAAQAFFALVISGKS